MSALYIIQINNINKGKLLGQQKPRLKAEIYYHNCISKVITQTRNQHLGYLVEPSFKGANNN